MLEITSDFILTKIECKSKFGKKTKVALHQIPSHIDTNSTREREKLVPSSSKGLRQLHTKRAM